MRSTRFLFLLEELGAPYEVKRVTIRSSADESGLDPGNPHPHGKVPVIAHNGEIVFESPAIALYLTDAFPANGLGPKVGEPKRGSYLSFLMYYGSVLEPAFMSKFQNTPVPRGTAGWVVVEEAMDFLIKTLSVGPYLLGERFSAGDVLYGTSFAMFSQSPLMQKSTVIEAYAQRVTTRPAHAKALDMDQG